MGNRNSSTTQVDNGFYQRAAYQIIHVVKDSPAEKFTSTPLSYQTYVHDALKRNPILDLTVFNCAIGSIRKVSLKIGQYGVNSCNDRSSEQCFDLTGFIVRPIIISEAITQVEHVQDVSVGSAAFQAGLVPHFDYIIATDDGNCFDLHQIVQPFRSSNSIRLYIIDIVLRSSRIVEIMGHTKLYDNVRPIGCTLARGYLHRIPIVPIDLYVCEPLDRSINEQSSSTSAIHCNSNHSIRPSTHGKNDITVKSTINNNNNMDNGISNVRIESSDPNTCTFTTKLSNQVPNLLDPISVKIPKHLVTSVVADLVQYQLEHREQLSTSTSSSPSSPSSTSTSQSTLNSSLSAETNTNGNNRNET
ncbi:hypothetical protein RDWZM_010144 [Blomia tropicalis]|uniref:PDZ GRASP-type domain-containing protein n=1 Tax=Blomia tropicalis TaxID=40697 RepID=A0A9Q0LYI7_BLOTA|nr:hypothetical protein RDWZM_010144 [Blomia tropicalis]